MFRRTWIARLFGVAAAVALSAGSASAGLLPVSVTVQPEGNNFRWTYSVVLPTDTKLQAGNYFTIYDFAGYQDGSALATATSPDPSYADYWSVSTTATGPTPNGVNPQDDPAMANITFTYNGPDTLLGQLGLGNFVAVSAFGTTGEGAFTATTVRASDGVTDSNITDTLVPVGQNVPPPSGVPEPTTLALAGLGLPLVGLARYIRRKGQRAPAA